MDNKLKHHGTNTTLVSTSDMYSRIISNIGDINLLIDLKGKILKINLPNKNINKCITKCYIYMYKQDDINK